VERRNDPNDLYADPRIREERLHARIDKLKDPKNIENTKNIISLYNMKKNVFYGVVCAGLGGILSRKILGLLAYRQYPLHWSVLLSAPASIISYYWFVGLFDNQRNGDIIYRLVEDLPVLLMVRAGVDLFNLNAKVLAKKINAENLKLIANTPEIHRNSLVLKRLPWPVTIGRYGLSLLAVLLTISVYEERIITPKLKILGDRPVDTRGRIVTDNVIVRTDVQARHL